MLDQQVQRYIQLFQTALVYTISIQLLDHVISTTNIRSLPIIIMSLMCATTISFVLAGAIETLSAKLQTPTGNEHPIARELLNLFEHLLQLGTDVLVQFISVAVGRFTIYTFSTSQNDRATALGVLTGVTLIYGLRNAINRSHEVGSAR